MSNKKKKEQVNKSTSINILGIEYNVLEQNIIESNPELMGMIDTHLQKIYLKSNLSEDVKNQTLLHEIIHAIFQQLGFIENEQVIQQLATSIYRVFKENNLLQK